MPTIELTDSHQAIAVSGITEPLRRQRAELLCEIRQIVSEAIQECSHPVCRLRWLDQQGQPWIICVNCGLTEQGWGCGFHQLKHGEYADLPKISSDDWYRTRTRAVFQSGETIEM